MTEPQTEAGQALMRFMGWGPAWAKKIRRIELEGAAGLLDQNDRLRSALRDARPYLNDGTTSNALLVRIDQLLEGAARE